MNYLLVVICAWIARTNAQTCNGSPEFCNLRFDQITLTGSHGAGAGFKGRVKDCEGDTSLSDICLFQTQNLSINAQLDRGVRFLSLDICILPQMCNNATVFGDLSTSRLVTCQGSEDATRRGFRYGGRLIDVFEQVDSWLRNNTNEVIGLYFTRNIPSSNITSVGAMIASALEDKWGEGATNASTRASNMVSATEMSTYFSQTGNWPTLLTAINDNRRIIVYFDSALVTASFSSSPWLHPPAHVTPSPFSGDNVDVDATCSTLDNLMCSGLNSDTLILSGYGYLTCLNNAQVICNRKLDNATLTCFDSRIRENRTVNVILVDFAGSGPVQNITSELNQRNVLVFDPEPVPTTSVSMVTSAADLGTNSGDSGSTVSSRTDSDSNNIALTMFTGGSAANSVTLSSTLVFFTSLLILYFSL